MITVNTVVTSALASSAAMLRGEKSLSSCQITAGSAIARWSPPSSSERACSARLSRRFTSRSNRSPSGRWIRSLSFFFSLPLRRASTTTA